MSQASLLSPSPEKDAITRESFTAHVLAEITRVCGPQLPCFQSPQILGGFYDRFGPEAAMAVCNQALNEHGGMWRSAPVTVLRFQEGQDGFFARPLLEEARAE